MSQKPKGLKGFRKEKVVEQMIKDQPNLEKIAFEARYAAQQLEKLYNSLYEMTMSLDELVGGVTNALLDKKIFTKEELDASILSYTKRKVNEVLAMKVAQMGYKDPVEEVEEDSLAYVTLDVKSEGKSFASYPRKMFLQTKVPYLFPGLEGMLVGMKKDQNKKFNLTMPKNIQVKEIQGKDLDFEVTLHSAWKRGEKSESV